MEQVRVGEDDVRVVADPTSFVGRRVTVEGGQAGARHGQGFEAGALIGRQRLRRRQVETRRAAQRGEHRGGHRVERTGGGGQHRHLVGEGLSRCGARRDDDVLTGHHPSDGLTLVRPEFVDSGALESRPHESRNRVRPRRRHGLASGPSTYVTQLPGALPGEDVEHLIRGAPGVVRHRERPSPGPRSGAGR